ncbi:uncharacterized protein LOC119186718 [Rhipicephalus microplus]|uniref:uncharacterized protein LOC119186718 n=1 Tax=Rhipicephalus microplus TaxID=6941 RepID=UPI003F6CAF93
MESGQECEQLPQSQQQREREKQRRPMPGPDGRRSWLVAVACAWNLLWSSLIRRSTGVIYVALLRAFGATREQSSWVLSVGTSIAWLMGPVVGILTKYVPLMALSFVGSIVTAISAIGCAFAGDMTAIFLLLGICSGIGNGIVMPTNDLIIGKYFKKYRGSGNGIYYTGGTLAAFAFPPILHLLLQEYGFTGAFLITGGLMLNAVSACIVFKAPPWEASKSTSAKVSPTAANEGGDGHLRRGSVASLEFKEQVSTVNSTYKTVVEGGATTETNIPTDKDAWPKASLKSTSILQSCEDFTSYANGSSPDIPADITTVSSHEISEGRADQAAANGTMTTYKFPPSPKPVQFHGISFRFLKRKPIGDGDVPSYSRLDGTYNIQNGEACSSGSTGITTANGSVAKPWTVSEVEVIAVDDAVESLRRPSLTGRETLVASGGGNVGTSHWSFLREPVFFMVTVTCAISVYTLLVLMILVDLAVDKGFTRRDGAVFLSVTAIGDACARLVAGALSDRSFCDRRVLMSASAMLTGVLCASLPTMRPDRYALTALMCVLFGWSNGSVVVLFGPVLADQLGVENLGLSGGITRFVMGIAYLASPKITGYFKDEIGSYDGLLHMVSVGSFFVCVMWTTEFTYRRIKKRRANRAS